MAYMDVFPMYHIPAHIPEMLGFAALATLAVCQAVQPGRLVRCQRLLALRARRACKPPAGCGVPRRASLGGQALQVALLGLGGGTVLGTAVVACLTRPSQRAASLRAAQVG